MAPPPSARLSLIRGLVFYGALLALALLFIAFVLNAGVEGLGFLTIAIAGVVAALLAYQVWTHVLDLRAPLRETEGVVARKWSRADLVLVWHSYYVTIEKAVFKISPEDYVLIEKDMAIKIVHFPHTLNVVSVKHLPKSPSKSAAT